MTLGKDVQGLIVKREYELTRVIDSNELDIAEIRKLFLEYAESLPHSLCFQNFNEELATLPGKYRVPDGCLIMAKQNGCVAGCVGLRPIGDQTCEMKRLYVRPEFHGCGIGRGLVEEVIKVAKDIGYERMRLDTMPSMVNAIALYRKFGFVEIEPYCENPVEGALFME